MQRADEGNILNYSEFPAAVFEQHLFSVFWASDLFHSRVFRGQLLAKPANTLEAILDSGVTFLCSVKSLSCHQLQPYRTVHVRAAKKERGLVFCQFNVVLI